jgi:hypothetical protein
VGVRSYLGSSTRRIPLVFYGVFNFKKSKLTSGASALQANSSSCMSEFAPSSHRDTCIWRMGSWPGWQPSWRAPPTLAQLGPKPDHPYSLAPAPPTQRGLAPTWAGTSPTHLHAPPSPCTTTTTARTPACPSALPPTHQAVRWLLSRLHAWALLAVPPPIAAIHMQRSPCAAHVRAPVSGTHAHAEPTVVRARCAGCSVEECLAQIKEVLHRFKRGVKFQDIVSIRPWHTPAVVLCRLGPSSPLRRRAPVGLGRWCPGAGGRLRLAVQVCGPEG